MASSEGSGGRTSSATLPVITRPTGFTSEIRREQSKRGAGPKDNSELINGLLYTLIAGDGAYVVSTSTGPQMGAKIKLARTWAKDFGAVIGFTTPATEKDKDENVIKVTRGLWAHLDADASPEVVKLVNEMRIANGFAVADDSAADDSNGETPVVEDSKSDKK